MLNLEDKDTVIERLRAERDKREEVCKRLIKERDGAAAKIAEYASQVRYYATRSAMAEQRSEAMRAFIEEWTKP
jgi:hypothetical protein